MKHLAVLLLAANGAFAGEFTTGQAARALIGQPHFTAQLPAQPDPMPSDFTAPELILGAASGLTFANDTLFVADSNRVGASPIYNRILIYNSVSSFLPAPTAEVPQGVSPDHLEGTRCPLCRGQASVVLGQDDFTGTDWHLSQNGMRLPTALATDGVHLAVADTDNNRVLIWNSIPAANNAPADVVVGQPDFKTNTPNSGTGDVRVPSPRSLRGPQGVWIQSGKLFVADDMNHRVLIWNSIPAANFKEADVVLGQPNFSSAIEPDLTKKTIDAQPNTLLNPVSVSSDGVHLFVADLGHNRVLIWNSIPTQNQAPADVVIGQPDMTTAIANYTGAGGVCPTLKDSTGATIKDTSGNDTYPDLCGATMNFPRFALSDGTRLFVADGGNDRVLIFNQIPAQNGATADIVLGQIDGAHVQTSDDDSSVDVLRRASSDSVRTPMSLAWDGTNLYVSEPFSRRILIFTPGSPVLPLTSIRNAASLVVYAIGVVTIGGTITENDEVTVTIQSKDYKYKIKKDDTLLGVIDALVAAINAGDGDPNTIAIANYAILSVILTAKVGGEDGNNVTLATTVSTSATITAAASAATLEGASDTAKLAPGTLVSIFGQNLTDSTASAPADANPLPTTVGGVQVYVDGRLAPILSVSPTQVNAQIPFETYEATSASVYVRAQRADGTVTATTALGTPIIGGNPGVFTYGGMDPRPAVALHASSQAFGTVIIEGVPAADDSATVNIEDRSYTYTAVDGDTLYTIRDNLVAQINASDPQVYAAPTGQWWYLRLYARVEGPAGEGIAYSASAKEDGNLTVMSATSALCCANIAGTPVTADNPAIPGETIVVLAAGLGMVEGSGTATAVDVVGSIFTGWKYRGPVVNRAASFVNAMAGDKSAGVYYAGLKQETIGIYEVDLELNPDLPTNPATQCWIAQDVYRSNIFTIPVQNPAGP